VLRMHQVVSVFSTNSKIPCEMNDQFLDLAIGLPVQNLLYRSDSVAVV
jgi:hypothetical protein